MSRVLFLCTGNSCRSQMAEGFARQLPGDDVIESGIHERVNALKNVLPFD